MMCMAVVFVELVVNSVYDFHSLWLHLFTEGVVAHLCTVYLDFHSLGLHIILIDTFLYTPDADFPRPKWKDNLNKCWDRLKNHLNGSVVDEIAGKLKELLEHRTYLKITNAPYTDRIEKLLVTIYDCEDDTLFNQFCVILKEMNHSGLANTLMDIDHC